MGNLDDSENNAKISDSAYSNSCSNSQSRRSHSSKSTHSGSNSSGSSGYGGKPSTSGSSNNNTGQLPKKDKDSKKKKQIQKEPLSEETADADSRPPDEPPLFEAPQEESSDVVQTLSPVHDHSDNSAENMEICTFERNSVNDEGISCSTLPLVSVSANAVAGCTPSTSSDGFSCVISMHDGVVMFTTSSLTTALGYPKDMWIGRSFIDFLHPRDRSTFTSQISNEFDVPKIVNGMQQQAVNLPNTVSTMVCRVRKYRGLSSGFGVREKSVTFMPFLLKLTFKSISDEEGKVTYLIMQAAPFFSAFKVPNEIVTTAIPFVMKHAANGIIVNIDPESVPYLGYLPQDLTETNAMTLYHPEDLFYIRQVYETIVKEGGLPRCRSYRMMTQNGDYVKLETEWSSFINPWSKKLEYVFAKHHIIEGPANPDVFQARGIPKLMKGMDIENNKAQMIRENIIKILNEGLTKPAGVARQHMTKRCQDLTSLMESLIEEQPKTDDELRLEIQDADHSYYERDSVMLGGLSPHHEYNDSKSSTETPLSYNQLNYNETLQRFFDLHEPYSFEDYNNATGENIHEFSESLPMPKQCLSPIAQDGDSSDMNNCYDAATIAICRNSSLHSGLYHPLRLTVSLLNKHDAEMERELMKVHRESRSSSKGERKKMSSEVRQKQKEHLARCNASYHPTNARDTSTHTRTQGVKRSSKQQDTNSHKHHCTSPRQTRRRQRTLSTSAAVAQPSSTITTTVAATQWPAATIGNMNNYVVGVGMPPQMPYMGPVTAIPGMIPMYYVPAIPHPIPTTSVNAPSAANQQHQSQQQRFQQQFPHHQFQPQPMPCIMYGHPMYVMPTPMNQVQYPMQQQQPAVMAQSMQYMQHTMNPLGLANSNYEEACKPSYLMTPAKVRASWRNLKRGESEATSSKNNLESGESTSSKYGILNRDSSSDSSRRRYRRSRRTPSKRTLTPIRMNPQSADEFPETRLNQDDGTLNRLGHNEETVDKTDGESSYSSFYSSFFKTESGSADDSGDAKKAENKPSRVWSPMATSAYFEPRPKKLAKRKMEPPWMDQVCVTSELIYKYQVMTKTVEEVLAADKEKLAKMEQPLLVNDQLGQLYLDLQLEGVASRLTLDEGITSSSSSGEETSSNTPKAPRKKRQYSKLVMIYEEDAPLPSPTDGEGCSSNS